MANNQIVSINQKLGKITGYCPTIHKFSVKMFNGQVRYVTDKEFSPYLPTEKKEASKWQT